MEIVKGSFGRIWKKRSRDHDFPSPFVKSGVGKWQVILFTRGSANTKDANNGTANSKLPANNKRQWSIKRSTNRSRTTTTRNPVKTKSGTKTKEIASTPKAEGKGQEFASGEKGKETKKAIVNIDSETEEEEPMPNQQNENVELREDLEPEDTTEQVTS